MYKVIKNFTDLQDDNYKYEVGDEYPRLGLKPSISRITELSGSNNKQRTPLIVEVEDIPENVPTEEEETKEPKKTTRKSTKKEKVNKDVK